MRWKNGKTTAAQMYKSKRERERETSTIDVTVAQQKTAATTAKNLTWSSLIWMQKKRAKSVLFTGSETRLTRMRDEQEKEKSKKKKRASRQDKKKQICKKKKNYDTLQNENPHFKKKMQRLHRSATFMSPRRVVTTLQNQKVQLYQPWN